MVRELELHGYDAIIGREKAPVGEILKQNGYATSWFGKNHNTQGDSIQSVWTVRPVAERDGLRLFLWLYGRGNRPVEAMAIP